MGCIMLSSGKLSSLVKIHTFLKGYIKWVYFFFLSALTSHGIKYCLLALKNKDEHSSSGLPPGP